MSFNFENVSTVDFSCIKLNDGSVYYGQTKWVDQNGEIVDAPAEGENNPNLRQVRHGVGVQIYTTDDPTRVCRYEGNWSKDQMTGAGKSSYPDKSVYNGNLKNGVKDGYGKFIWPNGDVYDGNWKDGRIEGGGKFIHHEGNVLSGMFKNGCYNIGNETYVNPFLPRKDIDYIMKGKKSITLAKEATKKEKLFIFDKAESYERAAELIKKSCANRRIPVVIASRESYKTKEDFYTNISRALNKRVADFDLRKASLYKKDDEKYKKYMAVVKKGLAEALMTDQAFVINIDDTDEKYEEIYDPDLREFYDPFVLPTQILNPDELVRPEIRNKVAVSTEFRTSQKTGTDYNIIIWSKFRVNADLEPKKVLEKFENSRTGSERSRPTRNGLW